MLNLLLAPPLAFVVYLALVGVLYGVGRFAAGRPHASSLKSGAYASGEAAPARMALPGYRSFFVIALFFAVLHLGALVLGSSDLNWLAAAYTIGLALVLLALILK